MKEKICRECKKSIPNTSEYFYRNKRCKDGLETKCKKCMNIIKKKRYKNIIYELYCLSTNTYYIGQTIKPLNDRISKHFSDAKDGRKQHLYDDIRKYGRELFTYREIEEVGDVTELDNRERYWIDEYIKLGFQLYNNEFGGRKNVSVPYKTRVRMAVTKGTKPFYVLDINKNIIGKFEKLIDANKKLGTAFKNSMIENGYPSKGYIAIYEYMLTEENVNRIISGLIIMKNGLVKKYYNRSGDNNPMYRKGFHFYVYDINHNLINEYFTYTDCIKELNINLYSIKKYMDTYMLCKRKYYFSTKKI